MAQAFPGLVRDEPLVAELFLPDAIPGMGKEPKRLPILGQLDG
jgi:hypothetical protein